MQQPKPLSAASTGASALEALRASQAKKDAENVISGNDLSSLNKFLQWSTAHSTPPSDPAPPTTNPSKTPEQLAKDREWLDQAFPDMFAGVKQLIKLIRGEHDQQPLSTQETEDALHALQEYFVDLNYAVNIDKLGALEPVLHHARTGAAPVRAAAVWVLGSAMQALPPVKDAVMAKEGHLVLVEALRDEDDSVRAKAVMASSALLRHSPPQIQARFSEAGGDVLMRRLLADANVQVRRRARFFLQFARETGNEAFVKGLLRDRVAVSSLSVSVAEVDVADVADVEAAVGALTVLAETDRQGLFQVAPELPGVVDELVSRCHDQDTRETLEELARILG